MRREQQDDLIADYIARGGTVRRLATPEPTTVSDILDYLRDCDLEVRTARGHAAGDRYIFQNKVVTLWELVSIANEHRAKRKLPPFQVVERHHSART